MSSACQEVMVGLAEAGRTPDSRSFYCADCRAPVWISRLGLRWIKLYPFIKVVCAPCAWKRARR